MNRIIVIARVIETLVVVPVFFLVFERMGDNKVLAFLVLLSFLFAADWLKDRLVKACISRKQNSANQGGG